MRPALAALLVCAVSVRARTEPDLPRAVPQPDTDPRAEDAARDTPVQTDGGSGPGLTALAEGQLRLATQKALSDLSDYVREALTTLRQEVQQVQPLGQRRHDELDHAVATLRQEARRAQVLGAPCRSDPDCSALRADSVCGGEGRCVCGEGLQEVAGGACRPYPRLSEPCRRHADCQGATERSECSGNICVGCWEGYVSSNGSACRRPRLSEACTRSAQCEVLTKHSVCNESQCACEEHFWNDRNLACRRSPNILDGRNTTVTVAQEEYYGTFIGHFRNYAHDIAGAVYAASEDTIFIKGFTYDGNGPDAFFWIGETERPSPDGILLPYPDDGASGPAKVLQGYNNADIVLRLPAGRKVQEMKWLSIWCRRFTVNFGDVLIPDKLVTPEKVRIGRLSSLAHSVSSGNIEILNAKTFYIPNFHYDGGGPDAYFWVGNGSQPSPNGVKVPDERGSDDALRAYLGQDIEITLPGSLTVYDIDWLAVWCVQYRHNFGSVTLPQNLSNVPPYLGQALQQVTLDE